MYWSWSVESTGGIGFGVGASQVRVLGDLEPAILERADLEKSTAIRLLGGFLVFGSWCHTRE